MFAQLTGLLTRLPLIAKLALGVALLGGAAFAYWTISPLFITTRVDEAFPVAAASTVQATSLPPATPIPTVAPTAVPTLAAAATALPATTAPEPTTAPTAVPEPTAAPTTVPEPTVVPTPAEPVVLARGSFTQIDRLHGADGMAVIYQLPDGTRILRFEGFDSKNGPDLRVSFSGHAEPRSRAEAHDSGYIEIARLKATQGNQNYPLPADFDLAAFKSVLIYCEAFHVVFSSATLQ